MNVSAVTVSFIAVIVDRIVKRKTETKIGRKTSKVASTKRLTRFLSLEKGKDTALEELKAAFAAKPKSFA